MFEFIAAAFLLMVTPGPGVLSAAGVGAAYGQAPAVRYVAGLWIGNNLVSFLVITGVAATVLALPWLAPVLIWGSALYLAWLGLRIAMAGAKLAFIVPEAPPGFANGVALQIINPKAYAIHTAFFSNFAILPAAPVAEVALKVFILNAIWIPVHALWVWAGIKVRALHLGPKTTQLINFGMAGAMMGVVGLAIWAQIKG